MIYCSDTAVWKQNLKGLLSACLSSYIFFCLFQSYIHGSSQAQFVAESHIILLLNILSHKSSFCTMDLSLCSVNEMNRNNPLTSYRSVLVLVTFQNVGCVTVISWTFPQPFQCRSILFTCLFSLWLNMIGKKMLILSTNLLMNILVDKSFIFWIRMKINGKNNYFYMHVVLTKT